MQQGHRRHRSPASCRQVAHHRDRHEQPVLHGRILRTHRVDGDPDRLGVERSNRHDRGALPRLSSPRHDALLGAPGIRGRLGVLVRLLGERTSRRRRRVYRRANASAAWHHGVGLPAPRRHVCWTNAIRHLDCDEAMRALTATLACVVAVGLACGDSTAPPSSNWAGVWSITTSVLDRGGTLEATPEPTPFLLTIVLNGNTLTDTFPTISW